MVCREVPPLSQTEPELEIKVEVDVTGDEFYVHVPETIVPEVKVIQDESSESKMKKNLVRRSKKQLREDLRKSSREEPVHINTQEELVRYSKKQLRELKAARQKRRRQEHFTVDNSLSSLGHGK